MFQLPHKLSELAAMALDDVIAVEQLPRFVVEMSTTFIRRRGDGRCQVCAAGAVMLERFDADETTRVAELGRDNANALDAIDQLRQGHVGRALSLLGKGFDMFAEHALDRDLPKYDANGADWHEAMQVLIDDLRKRGL